MLKKKFRKLLPTREKIKNHKSLQIFGKTLNRPELWLINRQSVATAFSVGLFFAWIPVPFQMFLAAFVAIALGCNLPISVVLVWITNPATMPPLFYFAYKVGSWVLGIPPKQFNVGQYIDFEFSISGIKNIWNILLENMSFSNIWNMAGDLINSQVFHDTWQPLILGSLVCAIVSSILGNVAIRLMWRYFIIKQWLERRSKFKNKKNK